jgi:hypothetical protein
MRDYIPLLGQPGGPDAQCFGQSQQLCYAVLEGVHYPQYEASAYYSGYLMEVRVRAIPLAWPCGLPACQWVRMTSWPVLQVAAAQSGAAGAVHAPGRPQ